MRVGPLDISEEEHDGVLLLVLAGEIDMATAPALVERVRTALQRGTRRFCIDLGGVVHLDSSGIAALVNVRRYAMRADGSLALVCAGGPILEVFELTGIARYFRIEAHRDAALQALTRA